MWLGVPREPPAVSSGIRVLEYVPVIYRLVSWALGPSGVRILEWYAAHQLPVNATVVAVGLLAIIFPRHRDRLASFLGNLWQRTPFALPEEDRQRIEEYKARARERAGLTHTSKKGK